MGGRSSGTGVSDVSLHRSDVNRSLNCCALSPLAIGVFPIQHMLFGQLTKLCQHSGMCEVPGICSCIAAALQALGGSLVRDVQCTVLLAHWA